MKKIFIALLIGLLSFSLLMTEAQAKRFGGGRSFGAARQTNNFSAFNANRATPAVTPAAAKPASGASKWLGPLAGLAAGGLLASLFMGHGLGSGILSWLLVGGIVLLLWHFIRNRLQPNLQPTQQNSNMNFNPQTEQASSYSNVVPFKDAPLDFDEAAFLRQVKATFVRLQAAYDAKNMMDIRQFTTPEVFAEIQLQLQERGDANNFTEVVNIEAILENIHVESNLRMASVMFKGLIREEQDAIPIAIQESWQFQQGLHDSTWIVAGIEQH